MCLSLRVQLPSLASTPLLCIPIRLQILMTYKAAADLLACLQRLGKSAVQGRLPTYSESIKAKLAEMCMITHHPDKVSFSPPYPLLADARARLCKDSKHALGTY
jgi:hypothetical protein